MGNELWLLANGILSDTLFFVLVPILIQKCAISPLTARTIGLVSRICFFSTLSMIFANISQHQTADTWDRDFYIFENLLCVFLNICIFYHCFLEFKKINLKKIKLCRQKYQIFTIVILVPILEEYFYRKLIFMGFSNQLGIYFGLIIQTIWFTLNHQDLKWIRILRTLNYALIYSSTNYLIFPIMLHSFNNFIAFLLQIYEIEKSKKKVNSTKYQKEQLKCNSCAKKFSEQDIAFDCISCSKDILNYCLPCHQRVGSHKSNHCMREKQINFNLSRKMKLQNNLAGNLKNIFLIHKNRNFLWRKTSHGQGKFESFTYQEVSQRLLNLNAIARKSKKIQPTKKYIGICLNNSLELIVSFFSAILNDFIVVFIPFPTNDIFVKNPFADYSDHLSKIPFSFFVTEFLLVKFLREMKAPTFLNPIFIILDNETLQPMPNPDEKIITFFDFPKIKNLAFLPVQQNDNFCILFTSGSSGKSKAVIWDDPHLSHSLTEFYYEKKLVIVDFLCPSHAFSIKSILRATGSGGEILIHSGIFYLLFPSLLHNRLIDFL